MRGVLQRVTEASVTVDQKNIGSIGKGICLLLGVAPDDGEEQLMWLVKKVVNLRIFSDEKGKMNRSLIDVDGALLVVSQFTLYGDCSAGRRPSFTRAADPDHAKALYEQFVQQVKKMGISVSTGKFGADMAVQLVNDGPVTLILETEN